jgi:hypothetical protein
MMMNLNLVYGKQLESNYLDAGETIAKEVTSGGYFGVSIKINDTFFGGGPLKPKTFAQINSVIIPKSPCYIENLNGHGYITIRKAVSISAVLGFVEGIPVIGSAIAIIKGLGHLYGMIASYSALKKAIKELNDTERNDFNVGRGASCYYTHKVFEAAIAYTNHQNQLVGSVLSLIPFVKPIVRIAQAAIYHYR